MQNNNFVSKNCKYIQYCSFKDTSKCLDLPLGCLKRYMIKEDAENP